MKTWHTKKLGEVIELHYGKGIARHDRKPHGKYPIYGANGELGRTDKYLVDGGAIIVGRKGSAGEITRVSGRFWPADVTYYVFGNKQIDVDYLFYILKKLDLKQLATGIKPGVNRNKVYELEIPLPPIEIQKKIVEKIEGLFAKIDEVAQLRDESSAASAALLPSALHQIFHTHAKVEGWPEKKLGELFEITSSKRVFKSEWTDRGVPFYRAREIVSMAKNETFKNPIFISEEMFEKYKSKYGVPKEGDILVTGVGTLGVSYVAKNDDKFYFKDGNIIWLRKISDADSQFIEYFFHSSALRDQIESNSSGATVGTFTITTAKATTIPLPPLPEQKIITAYLDALSQKSRALQELQRQTAKDLSALKQSILHQAFGGMV